MNSEKREFFRFDVQIPYFLEAQDTAKHCLHVHKEDLTSSQDIENLQRIDQCLRELFAEQKYIDNGGVALFAGLQHKLEIMAWLLDEILQGGDTFARTDYHQKIEQNQALQLPETDRSSKVFPLLEAFYERIENYIAELASVIDNSVQGKVFMYRNASPKSFNVEHYMHGLPVAAEQGNWLAQVILLSVEKLNLYENLFKRLKAAYKKLSNHQDWPIADVNLAAGGFAVHLPHVYATGSRICCLFKLDEEFVFARAVCVYQELDKALKRTAFQFEEISSEDEAHIVRFLRSKELESRSPD